MKNDETLENRQDLLTQLRQIGWNSQMPIAAVSVVPQRLQALHTKLPRETPWVEVTRDRVPLFQLYPTLGVDRAVAALGAGTRWGFPVLLIDGGTALTLTGVDGSRSLVGGAILPGIRLQGRSLAQKTAALPFTPVENATALPPRWATDTETAIHSGITYTILAGLRDFIQDWWQRFPDSAVVVTGGDGVALVAGLSAIAPNVVPKLHFAPHVLFWGMRATLAQFGDRPNSAGTEAREDV